MAFKKKPETKGKMDKVEAKDHKAEAAKKKMPPKKCK